MQGGGGVGLRLLYLYGEGIVGLGRPISICNDKRRGNILQ